MVSSQHEAMHRLFQSHPEVFGRAFTALNLPFPEPRSVALLPNDLTEIEPLERRVDTLLRIDTAEGPFLLLVEAQGRDDKRKFSAWAYYLAHVHAKYDLHPVLLVICQDTATAAWAAGPFHIGPRQWTSLIVRPLVLGPHNVQPITDLRTAVDDIPLATLSAITHANDPGINDILKTLATALQTIDEDDALIFAELTELGLGKSRAGQIWRQLMTVDLSFFRSETSQRMRAEARSQGRAEGRAEGLAEAVLRMLDRRGLAVPRDMRDQIMSCTDSERLLAWLDKAVSVDSADDLFTDES
ncbi:RpnC/YadD family protein [Nocardia sp. IFM 10818]